MMSEMSTNQTGGEPEAPVQVQVQKVKDPVCGMSVDPAKAKGGSALHEGHAYFFCNPRCAEKFKSDPQKYLQPQPQPAPEPHAQPHAAPHAHAEPHAAPPQPQPQPGTKVEYICPMDPEVVKSEPGACPICGMALEPRVITLEEGPNPELIDMTQRLVVSLVLSVPLFVIAMGEMIPGMPIQHALGKALPWVELALATPVVLWAGWPFFERGATSIKTWRLNMFTLIAIGTGTAFLYSVAAVIAPGIFPSSLISAHTGQPPLYFESAAVITTLVLVGQVLELRARGKAASAIRALLGLAPKTARRRRERGRGRRRRAARVDRARGQAARQAGGEGARRRDGDRGDELGR
jgi:Cu+-exporting ATPase